MRDIQADTIEDLRKEIRELERSAGERVALIAVIARGFGWMGFWIGLAYWLVKNTC